MSAEENRKMFPQFYEVLEQFRQVFGPVRVLYVEEGGNTAGHKSPAGVPVSERLDLPEKGAKGGKRIRR